MKTELNDDDRRRQIATYVRTLCENLVTRLRTEPEFWLMIEGRFFIEVRALMNPDKPGATVGEQCSEDDVQFAFLGAIYRTIMDERDAH